MKNPNFRYSRLISSKVATYHNPHARSRRVKYAAYPFPSLFPIFKCFLSYTSWFFAKVSMSSQNLCPSPEWCPNLSPEASHYSTWELEWSIVLWKSLELVSMINRVCVLSVCGNVGLFAGGRCFAFFVGFTRRNTRVTQYGFPATFEAPGSGKKPRRQ